MLSSVARGVALCSLTTRSSCLPSREDSGPGPGSSGLALLALLALPCPPPWLRGALAGVPAPPRPARPPLPSSGSQAPLGSLPSSGCLRCHCPRPWYQLGPTRG